MKFAKYLGVLALAMLGVGVPPLGWSADEACEKQSRELLRRLREEVLVDLDMAKQQQVAAIVLEVCEEQVQEIENRWWTESGDKPGNERLKRKSH